ncbi:MAG: DUF1501 domain-containing protein [Actinomycetota bacterium]
MSTLTRRNFLAATGVGTVGMVTALGTSISFAAPGVPNDGDVLVVLFLRGGMDGLSLTPPITDPTYYDIRPTIAIPQPGQQNGALRLDSGSNQRARFSSGFDGAFGLHPAADALHKGIWADGRLALIPGAGFPGASFSHFKAMTNHFRGSLSTGVGGGWIGRMVNAQGGPGPVAAVNTESAAALLRGASTSMGVVNSLDSFRLNGFANAEAASGALAVAYGGGDSLSAEGRNILSMSQRFQQLNNERRPMYANDAYGRMFNELGTLLKASPTLGIRAAAIASGGWDHHRNLGRPGDTDGRFHSLVSSMANGIQAFAEDTNGLDGITLVVISEFGRTTNENGNVGTDHGQATTMLVAGAGVRGGVYGDDFAENLSLPPGKRRGAVPIMTDFRKPILEIARKRARLADTGSVFPSFTPAGADLGLV